MCRLSRFGGGDQRSPIPSRYARVVSLNRRVFSETYDPTWTDYGTNPTTLGLGEVEHSFDGESGSVGCLSWNFDLVDHVPEPPVDLVQGYRLHVLVGSSFLHLAVRLVR